MKHWLLPQLSNFFCSRFASLSVCLSTHWPLRTQHCLIDLIQQLERLSVSRCDPLATTRHAAHSPQFQTLSRDYYNYNCLAQGLAKFKKQGVPSASQVQKEIIHQHIAAHAKRLPSIA